jgi:acyl carrier protein phosphodiesterase
MLMINIMFKNVDLNDKWWIELIKTINYFRNRFSMINKSIIFYEINTKRKSFFAHLRRIKTTSYVMKHKSITKWKKFVLKSFFAVFVKYEKNYIYQILRFNEIIYRVSFIIWIEKKREKSFFVETLNKISAKRSIIKLIESSTKKQILEFNSIIIFISSFQFSQVIVVSLFSILSTKKINTLNIESISSIFSIFSVLNRHFELRYRFDFFNSLNLLIMKCMKNVINFQQILKSRSYKKTMNDSNRKEWIKIMKNENNFFLINEIWTFVNSFKDRRVFRD